MVKITNDSAMDAMLQWIEDNTNAMWILASASAGMSFDGAKTHKLASATIASTVFTIANGDTSGRKTTVAIVSGISVTTTGSVNHVALVHTSNSTLIHLAQTSAQALTAGNSLNTSAFDIEVRNPT